MSEAKKRKIHGPEFKAKVGLEAVRGVKTINEIAQEYAIYQRRLHGRTEARRGDDQYGRTRPMFDNIFMEHLWRSVKHEDVH